MPKLPVKDVLVPNLDIYARFVHRDTMKPRGVFRTARHSSPIIPPTVLPVDGTGDGSVSCPMDHNDQYGICGPAMCLHVYNILTYRQGKGKEAGLDATTLANLLTQYLKVSGGDNGTDEAMLVGSGGIWRTGLAGDPADVVVDALDVDVTNVLLTQFLLDNFYTVQMAWSVPDDFIQGFTGGSVWANADTPDPSNGHYTPISDVRADGFYRLFTWGDFCWVSPAFVASVQPQCFVAFSPRQFDPASGLDSKGRHIVTQAAKWESVGGNPIPAAVINAFPPISGPTPPPGPTPVPVPTPTPPVPAELWHFNLTRPFPGGLLRISGVPAMKAGKYGVVADSAGRSVQVEAEVEVE